MTSPFDKLDLWLPEGAFELLKPLLERYPLTLKISRARTSKAGDYRPPQNGNGHIISVNTNLSPEAFLLTLIHEIAHLFTREEHGKRVKPHGPEWKETFRHLGLPFVAGEIFPENLREPLKNYLKNPSATITSHPQLYNKLVNKEVDPEEVCIEQIPDNGVFMIRKGRRFRRISKLRKNIKCQSLENGKNYVFKPVAMVIPLSC